MNIIICDDRIDDRKNLSDLLSDYGEKKNYEFAITEYDSGEQLCEEQSALEACQLLFLYRKFLKSSEIVYNRLEIKNDIAKERRGLRHDVVYEVFCFGLG